MLWCLMATCMQLEGMTAQPVSAVWSATHPELTNGRWFVIFFNSFFFIYFFLFYLIIILYIVCVILFYLGIYHFLLGGHLLCEGRAHFWGRSGGAKGGQKN